MGFFAQALQRAENHRLQNFQESGREAIITRDQRGTTLYAGGGNDRVHAQQNRDGSVDVTVNGEKHSFTAEEARSLVIDLGSGNDTFTASGTPMGANGFTVRGQAGNDSLSGSHGMDNLDGGTGNDTIQARGGNDTVNGGAGDDNIWAGAGNDTVRGGFGNDFIQGQAGHDTLHGGIGDDNIYGGQGNDNLSGGYGSDNIQGGQGFDQVYGNQSRPVAFTQASDNDVVNAGPQTAGSYYGSASYGGPLANVPSYRPPCLHAQYNSIPDSSSWARGM